MLAFLHRILDWFKNVFWKEEMELALVGLQNSGKTTFVNVISVRQRRYGRAIWPRVKCGCADLRMSQWVTL